MEEEKFLKGIRKYALISFLIPLITINLCLMIYYYAGFINNEKSINWFPNLKWEKNEHSYTWDKYLEIKQNEDEYSYTNCPKYKHQIIYTTIDNKILINDDALISAQEVEKLENNNKIKSVKIKSLKELDNTCIKNYKTFYNVIKKSNLLEKILIKTIINKSGYSSIKNPYFYGEVSISSTVRNFSSIVVFKSLIILSTLMLFLYWKNNFNFFKNLKNKKKLINFSNNFFYFGILSCIFLALHAIFIGLGIDSELFKKTRRLIIVLFILFELIAQAMLTKNLYNFKDELEKYINISILKIKVIFVIVLILISLLSFLYLAIGDATTAFKNILEWNYFVVLLFYYFLSRILWKKL